MDITKKIETITTYLSDIMYSINTSYFTQCERNIADSIIYQIQND